VIKHGKYPTLLPVGWGACSRSAPGDTVLLRLIGAKKFAVPGQLIEMSPMGFQVRHAAPPIPTGHYVQVAYPWGNVTVRVAWYLEIGDEVLTEFVLS
jgi:hypothetical protein